MLGKSLYIFLGYQARSQTHFFKSGYEKYIIARIINKNSNMYEKENRKNKQYSQ